MAMRQTGTVEVSEGVLEKSPKVYVTAGTPALRTERHADAHRIAYARPVAGGSGHRVCDHSTASQHTRGTGSAPSCDLHIIERDTQSIDVFSEVLSATLCYLRV